MESTLNAETRTDSGSAAARRLRSAGWLPAVLNGQKGKSKMIKLNSHDFELILHAHTSENLVLDVAVDGKKPHKVLLKEVQHDAITGDVLHADLVEISMTKKMRVGIPVRLVGEAEGVVQDGGILEHSLREIDVECLPGDIVEEIDLDVTSLKIGDSLRVSDLKVDSQLTVVTAEDLAIVSVSAPRVEAEEAPAEEEGAEGAEPEVVGEKKEEEESEKSESEKE